MITEEELNAALYDAVGDELMSEIRADATEALLKKYIIVERPELADIGVADSGRVRYNGHWMSGRTVEDFRRVADEAEANLKYNVRDYTTYSGIADFLGSNLEGRKHGRREEISKEMGHPVYMYAPQTIKTLIARLVDEEFKNGRN